MTHAAILSQKYKKFLCNDLYPHGVNLFKNALNGEYSKPQYLRWVSREEFFAKKDTDDFVKMCYSFGNAGNNYMYSKELEPLKKGFHYAVVFDDWRFLEQYAKENNWREGLIDELKKSVEGIDNVNERRLALHRCTIDFGIQQPNQRILQNIPRWSRIDDIKELATGIDIDFHSFDYRDYQHEEGDVVYCDPPYAGVEKYDGREFNHEEFWEWVRTSDYPVYVSEYNAPDDFPCIWQKEIPKKFAGGKSAHQKATEHLYIHNTKLNSERK